MKDYNENLVPWQKISLETRPAKGSIETYEHIDNLVWQTRSALPTEYENNLGDALETVLVETHELAEVIAKLNTLGINNRDGNEFTEENFTLELSHLAKQ